MTKVEASTLEEAYELAATQLSCSITELQYEIVQYPTNGVLGLFKKNAIIVATVKPSVSVPDNTPTSVSASVEEEVAQEIVSVLQTDSQADSDDTVSHVIEEDTIVEQFFESDQKRVDEDFEDAELAQTIEESLKHLLSLSCFEIDIVEVDVVDNTALIFIDGEDAALLIGKEGYRYNALSYMLFNWLHSKYQLYIKLEIAEFLTSQQEMIRNYIQPVIENVEKYGKGKTRFLDGILVQIALEQLREAFPDKYVAIKTARSGKRFVVINEFHKKSHG
jgi:spoIIIJ-associated protein